MSNVLGYIKLHWLNDGEKMTNVHGQFLPLYPFSSLTKLFHVNFKVMYPSKYFKFLMYTTRISMQNIIMTLLCDVANAKTS